MHTQIRRKSHNRLEESLSSSDGLFLFGEQEDDDYIQQLRMKLDGLPENRRGCFSLGTDESMMDDLSAAIGGCNG